MKSLTDVYTLSNGVTIPCVGFGTWQTPDGDVAVSSVKAALAAGYRHIDTAAAYGNEGSVGRGLVESGVDRKDVFVTTKPGTASAGDERKPCRVHGVGPICVDLFNPLEPAVE